MSQLTTFIVNLIISALAVAITAWLLPGVHIQNDSILTAFIVALVLSFLNAILKPIMIVLTIPVTVFSFGLFLLVINACIIILAARLVDGFKVDSFWWALLFSLILSLVTSILQNIKRRDQSGNNQ
jgi:putative membrane protein